MPDCSHDWPESLRDGDVWRCANCDGTANLPGFPYPKEDGSYDAVALKDWAECRSIEMAAELAERFGSGMYDMMNRYERG